MATKGTVVEQSRIVELREERARLQARLDEVHNDAEIVRLTEQLEEIRRKPRHERERDVDPFDDVDDPEFDEVTAEESLLREKIADRRRRLERVEDATRRALQENAVALASLAGAELKARTAEITARVHEHLLQALDDFDELAPYFSEAAADLGLYATDGRGPYVLLRKALLEAAGFSTPGAQNYFAVTAFTEARYGVGARVTP